ncbi:MAG: class I SAM-dependent methyltransferase [Acidobacteriota bacterium]
MTYSWPDSFPRIPDEDWVGQRVGSLARGYDTVEAHGWYSNLDPTVETVAAWLPDGAVVVDYSGGTGILTERLLRRLPDHPCGVVIADSSPKFLRLAVEKLRHDERVAFRRIQFLKAERRLQLLEEVLAPDDGSSSATRLPVDAIVSTNAIHLYYDLADTLASWLRCLQSFHDAGPAGRAFVQSGNIRNPAAPKDHWIIDETVEHIHRAAVDLVGLDARYERFRGHLDEAEHMAAHRNLRQKFFLPVRPLETYLSAFEDAGFEILETDCRPVTARVDEWYEFLAVYHEGVLGWAGGAEKVTGEAAPEEIVQARLDLMRHAMERVFGGRESFEAAWTYWVAAPHS